MPGRRLRAKRVKWMLPRVAMSHCSSCTCLTIIPHQPEGASLTTTRQLSLNSSVIRFVMQAPCAGLGAGLW